MNIVSKHELMSRYSHDFEFRRELNRDLYWRVCVRENGLGIGVKFLRESDQLIGVSQREKDFYGRNGWEYRRERVRTGERRGERERLRERQRETRERETQRERERERERLRLRERERERD